MAFLKSKGENVSAEEREQFKKEYENSFFKAMRGMFIDEDMDFEIKVYSIVSHGRGKKVKEYQKKYVNELIDEETIANDLGGGHYWLIGQDADGNIIDGPVHIAQRRSKIADNHPMAQNSMGNMMEQFQMMSAMMQQMMTPFMEAMKNFAGMQNQSPDKALSKYTESMIGTVNKITQYAVQQNMSTIRNANKPAPQSANYEWVKPLFDYIKPIADKVVEGLPFMAKINAAPMLEKKEELERVKNDEQALNLLYSYGYHDPEFGPEKMKKLFKYLDIDVPEQQPGQAGQVPEKHDPCLVGGN